MNSLKSGIISCRLSLSRGKEQSYRSYKVLGQCWDSAEVFLSGCKYQMQEREERKKPEAKICWRLHQPGMELETDVLSVLSSPSVGRSEVGGHSSVQLPHGQSFAVGMANTMLQWMGQL